MRRAWVLFSDETTYPLLKIFKRGFRHCWLLMQDESGWYRFDLRVNICDPFVKLPDVAPDFNLAQWYLHRDERIVEVTLPNEDQPGMELFPDLITCVSILKRVLGIHRWFIKTPHQLYQYLLQHGVTP